MNELWKPMDEFKYWCRRLFKFKKWNSFNFGIEIGIFYFTIYFLLWSLRIGEVKHG